MCLARFKTLQSKWSYGAWWVLMAWILHSLTTQQKTRKGGGSKKKQLEVQASLPIEQLLHWLYKEQMHCMETKVWRMNASMSAATSLKYCVLHHFKHFPWPNFLHITWTLSVNSGHTTFGLQSSCSGDGIWHESLAGRVSFGVYQSGQSVQVFRFQISGNHMFSINCVGVYQLLSMLSKVLCRVFAPHQEHKSSHHLYNKSSHYLYNYI